MIENVYGPLTLESINQFRLGLMIGCSNFPKDGFNVFFLDVNLLRAEIELIFYVYGSFRPSVFYVVSPKRRFDRSSTRAVIIL